MMCRGVDSEMHVVRMTGMRMTLAVLQVRVTTGTMPARAFVRSGVRKTRRSHCNQAGTAKNIGPWVLFNASVRYRFNPQTTLSLVANNIANKRPPIDVTNGGWPYYDTGDYNALGRAMYLEANWDFSM